ncbi:metalloregulator ArsR/SmtB family transcription factor [Marinococcus sp. PL1-022]|uniref:ArsR/SmtB family transcription factor n=1 Tax=Marinococcus sp. PL1-022 TaxID=3095363 RepID=UPI0029C3621E|nr:metalloregulator ArsR/SmtB family transcription factor [Marinococcus sp. PL1-022]MDX6152798.1 metalloregulator ArsR/SmtB family transcription factor [Marinococcus sp. PL1-022]
MAKTNDQCEIYCYDPEKVTRVQNQVGQVDARSASQWFKVLADETRYKVAYALSVEGELCGCDLANILGTSTATVSHHLRILKQAGAVTYRREGKLVFYTLAGNQITHLLGGMEPAKEEKPLGI